jgi:hypothetical protein
MTCTEVFKLFQAAASFFKTVAPFFQTVASIATVFIFVVGWRKIKLAMEQAKTTFEDGLTEQYRRIMKNIPSDIWLGSELDALGEKHRTRCRDAIYRYIDLSNEQAFLHSKKRVRNATWDEWRDGIQSNMKLPAFKAVWAQVKEKCPASFMELRRLVP